MNRRILFTTIVGSQLHGTDTLTSDTDRASVVVAPLRAVVSPFKRTTKHKHQDQVDHTFYELSEFIKLAVGGNPTILEVLWSSKREVWTEEAQLLFDNRHKLLNQTRIWHAHRSYARHQLSKSTMPSDLRRIGKASAAYLRVQHQGRCLLDTNEISYPLPEPLRSVCRVLKRGEMTKDQIFEHYGGMFEQVDLEMAARDNRDQDFIDIDWLESYLEDVYRG